MANHEYISSPAGRLTVYRCKHCGVGFATDKGAPELPCPVRVEREAPEEIPPGAGTELKKLLRMVGIVASPTCGCNAKARKMDSMGLAWCREHVRMIAGPDGWLHEEAKKRSLPYLAVAGERLVGMAISRAEKNPLARP